MSDEIERHAPALSRYRRRYPITRHRARSVPETWGLVLRLDEHDRVSFLIGCRPYLPGRLTLLIEMRGNLVHVHANRPMPRGSRRRGQYL